nr:putative late blight resistance protein homolog R1A-3 isoform X2 [Ipomoea batatas]
MLDVTLRRVLKDVEDLIVMIEARTAKVSLYNVCRHNVAVLQGEYWLKIKGQLDTRRLQKISSYSAYFIFKFKFEPQRFEAFTSVRYINDKRSDSENQRCQVFLTEKRSSEDPGRFSNCRHDGWMEIKLGDFYISSRNEGDVEMQLWNFENEHWKSGLIVKGIEVRPN